MQGGGSVAQVFANGAGQVGLVGEAEVGGEVGGACWHRRAGTYQRIICSGQDDLYDCVRPGVLHQDLVIEVTGDAQLGITAAGLLPSERFQLEVAAAQRHPAHADGRRCPAGGDRETCPGAEDAGRVGYQGLAAGTVRKEVRDAPTSGDIAEHERQHQDEWDQHAHGGG